jgi:hypothetical protein
MQNTTIVLGYWFVEPNQKRNLNEYLEQLDVTLSRLRDYNIVFYYQDDFILDRIRNIPNLVPKYVKIEDLPSYYLSDDYLNSCKRQDNEYLKQLNKDRPRIQIKLGSFWKEKGLLPRQLV